MSNDSRNKDKKKLITISREFGSGGRLIGQKLADRLGVPYYDKQLLDRIAEESGFSKEMMEDAEKKAKNSFLYSLASAMGAGESGPESLSLNEATNVFVYAEEADKIKRAVEQYGVPENEVKKLMKDTDKARANYYAYHTGRKWGEPVNYNLSIDSGYIEIDDIVDLIIMYTDRKLYK